MSKTSFRVGVDIFRESRMKDSLRRFGWRFVEKFARKEEHESLGLGFDVGEMENRERECRLLAQLFCAKEALFKMCHFQESERPWIRQIPMKWKDSHWVPDLAMLQKIAPGLQSVSLDLSSDSDCLIAVALGEFQT